MSNVTKAKTAQVNPEQLDVIAEKVMDELYEFREEHEEYCRARYFRCRCNRQ